MPSSSTLEAKSLNRVADGGAQGLFANAPALAFRPVAAPVVRSLEVLAPLSGVIVPLDSVPDPVFANRMVGDGVSIDPTSCEVLAPFAGEVTQLHDSRHAVAVTSASGVEVLIHVGLDTVGLRGRGFEPLVARGARVVRGQPLLRFDPELLAREARSLLTTVIVTNQELVSGLSSSRGFAQAGISQLLSLQLRDPAAPATAPAAGELIVMSDPIALPNPEGLHARPSAVLANEARRFTAKLRLLRGPDGANARSVVALMGLSTKQHQLVRVEAIGADAREAVTALTHLLRDGCGERPGDVPRLPAQRLSESPVERVKILPDQIAGAPASPGLAIGRVLQHHRRALVVPEIGGDLDEERNRLGSALTDVAAQLKALLRQADPFQAQILSMQLTLLEDPDLAELADASLKQGKSAPFAWQQAFTAHAARLEQLDNAMLRERAADVRDVGRRLLGLLAGTRDSKLALPENTILIAEEITPSEMASLDRRNLAGLCTTSGSSTSHVALLARSMRVPAICGAEESVLSLADGEQVVIDGSRGTLTVRPAPALIAQVNERIARDAGRRKNEESAAGAPARTSDGARIEVAANIGSLEEALQAVAAGAEGVGLLRSEFLFHDHTAPPSEDEQAGVYRAIAEALGEKRPLVIRTFDVGGDKPPAWLPLPREQNPFLGVRGIRVSFAWPDLFRAQLRAILRAAGAGKVQVMFPMISGLDELRAARTFLAEEQALVPAAVEVGMMIEVPAAALMAEQLAREIDFFSIGTNDLTQYTLAMDRGHPKLGQKADALHPAVLKMIDLTVQGAKKHGKHLSVCGGLASDPLAVPLLVGLGVRELSVSVPSIASVKAVLSRWTLPECQALATAVMGLGTTAEVRSLLADQAEARASGES